MGIIANRYSVLTRAVHFAGNVRTVRDLSSKVAGCFTALEALLCNGDKRVKEQLATRIAMLLGNTPGDQRRLYDSVRRLYKVRCEYVHGLASDRSGKSIRKASVEVAGILRDVIRHEVGVTGDRSVRLNRLSGRWKSTHGQSKANSRKKAARRKRSR